MAINYYNMHFKDYIKKTENIDMSMFYQSFLRHVKPDGRILDLGAGSGRDSGYFISRGHNVTAIDASEKMVEYINNKYGEIAYNVTIEDFETNGKFDGIWACASLLHIDKSKLKEVMTKYIRYLNVDAVFYMSFKERPHSSIEDERLVFYYSLDEIQTILESFKHVEILEIFKSYKEIDKNISQTWINALVRLR